MYAYSKVLEKGSKEVKPEEERSRRKGSESRERRTTVLGPESCGSGPPQSSIMAFLIRYEKGRKIEGRSTFEKVVEMGGWSI
jgi:hypothetical protein